MLKIKTDANKQIDIENKSIEISDRVSADGTVTISAKSPTEIKIIKAEAVKSVISDDGEVELKDASSVRKVVNVIHGVIAKNIKTHSENNGGSGAVSDEFTYTKTPGSIPKIFFHIGTAEIIENTYHDYYDDNRDRELTETEQWIYDHLVPRMRINGSSGELEEDGSCCVFMDADGVRRYEFGLYSGFSTRACLNSFYELTVAHPDKTIVIDTTGLTTEMNANDILEILASNDKLAAELANEKYNEYTEGNLKNRLEFAGITVVSSDLIFYNGWDGDWLKPYGSDSFVHYSTILANEANDISTKEDSSSSYKGMYIIEKAVQEGRALDLFVNVTDSDTIYYNTRDIDLAYCDTNR